jgi:hypothetical protein
LSYQHNVGAAAQVYAAKFDVWFQELEEGNF